MNAFPQDSVGSVLVVIPCLNEEKHIANVVTKLAAEADRIDLKIVIADGGSTDQTRSIIQGLARSNTRILLLENAKRIQSAGINSAVWKYGDRTQFLIRVDAHATYPDRYCETLLNVQARTLADSVVVSMHTEGSTCFQRAAAAVQNSILGNGGSAHRNKTADRWVDHGHHALMTIDAFKAVSGYDETFSHVEDVELDARLLKEGFRIYLTGAVQVTYYPRATLVALFRQYYNIGRGRARNFLKHRENTKLRHLVLVTVAPAICLFALVRASAIFAVPALVWSFFCLGYGFFNGIYLRDICATASGVAAIAMQASWSFGFFRGLIGGIAESLSGAKSRVKAHGRLPN
jgi:succinoglycan biosynthesis protein ExoA